MIKLRYWVLGCNPNAHDIGERIFCIKTMSLYVYPAYSVANEHVDEKKFHEKVLYRMRHNKYDSLRKSYNKIIKNKVNDVKQGLYQTIYLTLTIMAEDVADAKAHLVLWRVP